MKAIRAYNGSEESMRAFLKTIVWNKNLLTDELVKLRNDCANRPGAEAARRIFQEGQQRLTKDPNLRLKFDMRYTLPRPTTATQVQNDQPQLVGQLMLDFLGA